MLPWLTENPALLAWLGAASVVMFVGTLAAIPLVVARIPRDYFVRRRALDLHDARHPAVRLTLWLLRNSLGVVLVLLGIAMLVLPGQGILTILLGVMLVDFPGKRALELRLVRRPKVLAALNWLRARAGQPPLDVHGRG